MHSAWMACQETSYYLRENENPHSKGQNNYIETLMTVGKKINKVSKKFFCFVLNPSFVGSGSRRGTICFNTLRSGCGEGICYV